jgi:hypothetical protein
MIATVCWLRALDDIPATKQPRRSIHGKTPPPRHTVGPPHRGRIAERRPQKTTPDVDNRKAQTMRLSPEVLEGLRVRAERFRTTQAALVEQYLREAFERHPVPPYQGI